VLLQNESSGESSCSACRIATEGTTDMSKEKLFSIRISEAQFTFHVIVPKEL
jgi:hypothetical protein